MVKYKLRGHDVEVVDEMYVFSDTKELVIESPRRSCNNCNKERTEEGHDACLGALPLVSNACCGHGVISETYIQFFNFICIRGQFAKIIIRILKAITRHKPMKIF